MSDIAIGIGGGVGPEAGLELQKQIIQNTIAGGTDQGHIDVYHISRASDIVDRTEYLLNNAKENPADGMYRTAKALYSAAGIADKKLVMGIPCNTFHTPEIFNRFLELLEINALNITVINMLYETGKFIKTHYPKITRVGLMSTTGTRKINTYKTILEPLGFDIIEVPESMQPELHESIYNKEWGIKATNNNCSKAKNNFLRFAGVLENQGVDIIILGCSEIPLVLTEKHFNKIPLIDPVFVLARALIRETATEKLRPI